MRPPPRRSRRRDSRASRNRLRPAASGREWTRWQRSRRGTERSRAFDSLALAWIIHRLPQLAAPLHVEPKVGAVAEHAREDERRRRRHVPAVVAQLVDMLALNAHRLG